MIPANTQQFFLSCICSHVFSYLCLQADAKLREEEKRALRYLETRRECNSVQAVSIGLAFK